MRETSDNTTMHCNTLYGQHQAGRAKLWLWQLQLKAGHLAADTCCVLRLTWAAKAFALYSNTVSGCCNGMRLLSPCQGKITASTSLEREVVNYAKACEGNIIHLFEMSVTHNCTAFYCHCTSDISLRHLPRPHPQTKQFFCACASLFLFLLVKQDSSWNHH